MVPRYRPQVKEPPNERVRLSPEALVRFKDQLERDQKSVRPKAKAKRRHFTESSVLRLPVNKVKQHFVWDAGAGAARGLSILVNPTGTKTYFVNYRFPGSPTVHYKKLGRVGETRLEEARAAALEARRLANQNVDPKADDPTRSDAFETVWKAYIEQEQIGRKNNKSALETQSFVLNACAQWKPRAVATLSYRDIDKLLAGIRDGDADKGIKARRSAAARIYSHLHDFFNWCARSRIAKDNPMTHMP